MSLEQMLGILGLLIGVSGSLFGIWWGRRLAIRNRGIDERYKNISIRSLANGWKITLVSIYLFFILMLFGIKFSVAPVLGIILLIHMAGWAFSAVYYNLKF